jgi:NAD(P)-dependent dehydrogenase (short-subunit alcohol dehydrogenase family)
MSRALVVGAGGSLGVAACRCLSELGFQVLAAGRNTEKLAEELRGTACDLVELDATSAESVERALRQHSDIDVLLYNAGRIDLLPLAETSPETFLQSWQVNTLGAFLCARACAPQMLARGRGNLTFIGATSSVRGGARSHAFASAKHALRGLAACLAKELGPRGVHVSHLVIDGKIWGDRTRARFPDAVREQCLEPADVVQAIRHLLLQPPSAWTFELDLRPSSERFS